MEIIKFLDRSFLVLLILCVQVMAVVCITEAVRSISSAIKKRKSPPSLEDLQSQSEKLRADLARQHSQISTTAMRQEIEEVIQRGTIDGFPQEVIDEQIRFVEKKYAQK